jgi:hypothetical protein
MIKFSDCSKFATDPCYSEARGTCWGFAIFIATIIALGTIAILTAGLDLHTLVSRDQVALAYAQMNAVDPL